MHCGVVSHVGEAAVRQSIAYVAVTLLALAACTAGDPSEPEEEAVELTPRLVAAGYQHTCALTPDGAAYCWGFDLHGAIGAGTSDRTWSTPTAVLGSLSFSAITAGQGHTCALTDRGVAY